MYFVRWLAGGWQRDVKDEELSPSNGRGAGKEGEELSRLHLGFVVLAFNE
jgi:hypothetical protein